MDIQTPVRGFPDELFLIYKKARSEAKRCHRRGYPMAAARHATTMHGIEQAVLRGNIDLVYHQAMQWRVRLRHLPSSAQSDLVCAGTEGLLQAIRRHDPKKARGRDPFVSIAHWRIRCAVSQEIRRLGTTTYRYEKDNREIRCNIDDYAQFLQVDPDGDTAVYQREFLDWAQSNLKIGQQKFLAALIKGYDMKTACMKGRITEGSAQEALDRIRKWHQRY